MQIIFTSKAITVGIYLHGTIIKEIIYDSKCNGINVCVAFLDAAKAFDCVNHKTLFLSCSRAGMYLINVLGYWYSR